MNDKNEFNQEVGTLIPLWRSAKQPGSVVLKGRYCSVEPFDAHQHAEPLFKNLAIDNKGESWTYLRAEPCANANELATYFDTITRKEDTLFYSILNLEQEPIGIASYLRITPIHGVIEVGHLHFSKLLKKTPAATEAMYLMMQYAFENLGYRRYEWKCHSLNQASRNAALRLGFTFEGIFRQSNIFKSRNRDTAWFSILDSEWPALKAKFNRWLSPDNFDKEGAQIKSLRECK
jgi:RimJ/RimL family protein N-acetyltransferase